LFQTAALQPLVVVKRAFLMNWLLSRNRQPSLSAWHHLLSASRRTWSMADAGREHASERDSSTDGQTGCRARRGCTRRHHSAKQEGAVKRSAHDGSGRGLAVGHSYVAVLAQPAGSVLGRLFYVRWGACPWLGLGGRGGAISWGRAGRSFQRRSAESR